MAINIKWTGIEQYKYGLTARWYVSAYYGNDIDVDAVGYYNPSTNPTGHGGPTRPFATISKLQQDATITVKSIVIVDSGWYSYSSVMSKGLGYVGDGTVVFSGLALGTSVNFINNITLLSSVFGTSVESIYKDCSFIYCTVPIYYIAINNCKFIEVSFGLISESANVNNNIFIKCSGTITSLNYKNNIIINSPNITLSTQSIRPTGAIIDYSVIIGTVKSNRTINGKTTGVTVEDFKIDGNYFVKSYSEVDLFGNPSGSGASVAQLQTLFNNYFSPIYLDTWQDADFSLKPTASDLIKFGGLNGSYIGALPVGYRFSASDLWNTYKDAVNTSNIDYDMVNASLVITDGQEVGTYRSIRISLPKPITCDLAAFFANLVYNVEGTVKQGVANQRIDTTPDLLPDSTVKQRVVYDYKLSYASNNTDPLSAFKNFELNRTPWIDASGRSMLDELYVATERQRPIIQDFIIEFTLRKVIID